MRDGLAPLSTLHYLQKLHFMGYYKNFLIFLIQITIQYDIIKNGEQNYEKITNSSVVQNGKNEKIAKRILERIVTI